MITQESIGAILFVERDAKNWRITIINREPFKATVVARKECFHMVPEKEVIKIAAEFFTQYMESHL